MVIWLRHALIRPEAGQDSADSYDVGVDSDVLRHEAFCTVLEIDQAYVEARRQCEDLLSAAQRDSARLVEAAEQQIAAVREAAGAEFETAGERGYEAGMQQALAAWQGRAAGVATERRNLQTTMRARLAELVVTAVEQIVSSADPAALFAQAATAVERIVEDGNDLKVRVSLDDHPAALQAFERCAALWSEHGRQVRVSVVADRTLARGDCLCESDLGTVEASLATQLAAMRMAVERAMLRAGNIADSFADALAEEADESTLENGAAFPQAVPGKRAAQDLQHSATDEHFDGSDVAQTWEP